MKILFVCTGNICRSAMAELLMRQYLDQSDMDFITVSSAGTRGLPDHPIEETAACLLDRVGIDSQTFRSRRITKQIIEQSDLILCFERMHREQIAAVMPLAVRKTFLFTQFAQLCNYGVEHHVFRCRLHDGNNGLIPMERDVTNGIQFLIQHSSLIRTSLSMQEEIADPYRQDFEFFATVAEQIDYALRHILSALQNQ